MTDQEFNKISKAKAAKATRLDKQAQASRGLGEKLALQRLAKASWKGWREFVKTYYAEVTV